ncbi:MAG: hypothetical protein ACI9VT_003476 [Psychroserpens sp.]|jgi:hypothetical protein
MFIIKKNIVMEGRLVSIVINRMIRRVTMIYDGQSNSKFIGFRNSIEVKAAKVNIKGFPIWTFDLELDGTLRQNAVPELKRKSQMYWVGVFIISLGKLTVILLNKYA